MWNSTWKEKRSKAVLKYSRINVSTICRGNVIYLSKRIQKTNNRFEIKLLFSCSLGGMMCVQSFILRDCFHIPPCESSLSLLKTNLTLRGGAYDQHL